jgi:hypothetical protein
MGNIAWIKQLWFVWSAWLYRWFCASDFWYFTFSTGRLPLCRAAA